MTIAAEADFIVVGAGIAGASVAAELAAHGSVVVLEAESHPGYHTTGRSAAMFSESYGNAVVRALSRASRDFFQAPPAIFTAVPLVRPRGTMLLVNRGQQDLADRLLDDADIRARTRLLDVDAALARVPILRRELLAGAVLDPTSADIDVDLLLQGFLRQARSRGARLHLDCAVTALERHGSTWRARTAAGDFEAPVIVNAAGAWADTIGAMAGARSMRLQPLRRTAALVDLPQGVDASGWPVVLAIDESFYFKPDAGLLLISPADETASPPCDAQPEELDVAIAVDRFEATTGLQVRRVRRRWAGLRVFSPDRTPVIGFDPEVPGFFWCAGQGGYGIQTAPSLSRVAASLARGAPMPADVAALGVQAMQLSPRRFASSDVHRVATGDA